MHRTSAFGLAAVVTLALTAAGIAAQPATATATAAAAAAPKTIVLDGAQLAAIKAQVSSAPTPAQSAALAALTHAADQALTAGPWSVMDKKSTVSKDKHDYYSLATYFWPNPSTPDGCPYIHKDGRWGPTVAGTGDLTPWANTWRAINDLTLAWYYTGNAAYAQRAELVIRTWFLDPATKMNPNMKYGQVVPCTTTGRKEGIIETSQALTQVIDGLALLDSGAPGWTTADHSAMVTWLTQFQNWNRTSSIGKAESKATNNHGTFKDLQDSVVALYIGDTATAKTLISSVRTNRIAKQIGADGKQAMEVSRSRPWHYANFNLQALCRLAGAARNVNVNLWGYKAPNGATIAKAADFLIPAATKGAGSWPYQDLDVFDASLALDKLHAVAALGDTKAQAALPKVPAPAGGDLWPLVPTCWEDLSQPPVQK
ncbi:MAG: hypothetical protein AUI14_18710 [Actinobacteria bacterium 13_2_20CM_2_71_6]|nr:MAG: hypothetical protein AUI14_18710 [Actinobacteria bacterium 13_2_20CM_2_71_6]